MTDPTPNAPMPEPLSPAAQAVLDVYWKNVGVPSALAKELGFTNTPLVAALCAVADQVVPEEPLYGGDQRWMFERDARQASREKLLAIATELEALPND